VTEPRRFPPPWSVNYPDSNSGSVSSLTCAVAHGVFHRSASAGQRQQLGRPPLEVEGRLSVAARRAGTAIDCRFVMGYIVRARSLAVDAEVEVRGSVSLVRIFDVTLLDGSLLPAPISGWPDLEAFRGHGIRSSSASSMPSKRRCQPAHERACYERGNSSTRLHIEVIPVVQGRLAGALTR
jgi:hypothetical protein